jgi:linoleoyl-CoA desaturase
MFYYSYMVVLPLILVDITWWQLIIGFSTVHFILGFILAVTFQLAHLVEKTDFPDPIDDQIDENWYVHQLATTADFAQHNKILTWYIGGLNYQVEHHLFPHISHVHYPALSKIVKETTDEFKVRYNVYKNIPEALASHVRMLVRLGKAPVSA